MARLNNPIGTQLVNQGKSVCFHRRKCLGVRESGV